MTEGELHREFGAEWEIVERPGGLQAWTALRPAGNGRPERYIVARSPAQLLDKLRALRGEES